MSRFGTVSRFGRVGGRITHCGREEADRVEAAAAQDADGGGEPDRRGGGEAVNLWSHGHAVLLRGGRGQWSGRGLRSGCGQRDRWCCGGGATTRTKPLFSTATVLVCARGGVKACVAQRADARCAREPPREPEAGRACLVRGRAFPNGCGAEEPHAWTHSRARAWVSFTSSGGARVVKWRGAADAAWVHRVPEGIAAETREESQPMVPSTNANMLSIVKTHEDMETIAIVRMPAGRSARRLPNIGQWMLPRAAGVEMSALPIAG